MPKILAVRAHCRVVPRESLPRDRVRAAWRRRAARRRWRRVQPAIPVSYAGREHRARPGLTSAAPKGRSRCPTAALLHEHNFLTRLDRPGTRASSFEVSNGRQGGFGFDTKGRLIAVERKPDGTSGRVLYPPAAVPRWPIRPMQAVRGVERSRG